ncbi:MAG: glutaredoxin 3 [Porticoccaceae bacterium]|jgi:glutaredoxin 3|nr:glutaredoxin 3 [Porticoccaceae bacterium]MBT5577456.1 glutaredoxin 3 [Porticoccaceae bacterium]MBT7375094.1 glutaredoxin 3 [Porticoccaceae bacterium]
MSQVVLYGTRFCPFCTAARRLLTAKGINYQDIALDTDPKLRAEIMEKSSRNTVPQIWVGDVHVGGYTDLLELDVQGTLDSLINAGVEMPPGDSI